jgi:hypothetical protein
MEVTTPEARSGNDFERSQSEDALRLAFFHRDIAFYVQGDKDL